MNGDDERQVDAHIEVAIGRLEEQMRGHWRLDDERFRARDAAQAEVARQLEAFKVLSNEWRGALADLSSTKISQATYEARHTQLDQKIDLVATDVAQVREELSLVRGADTGRFSALQRADSVRTALIYAGLLLVAAGSLLVAIFK